MDHVSPEQSEQGTNLTAKTIFEPRTYPYGMMDTKIMAEFLPLQSLPRSLYPMRGGRFKPPTYWFGWTLSKGQFNRLRKIASKRGLERYRTVSELPDDPDDVDGDYIVKSKFDRTMTMQALGDAILEDLGITLRIRKRTGYVLAPGWVCRQAIFIFDNYHIKSAPRKEDIERLRAAWGFEDPPMWYPCALDGDWKNRHGVRYG